VRTNAALCGLALLSACFVGLLVWFKTSAALASVPLAAAAVAWRWRRLAGAPHAFPVGRLA
jgi:hypothetical protein